MSDIHDDEPLGPLHRCTMRRSRRGKPRVGEHAGCECGAEYLFVQTRFGLDWSPVYEVPRRTS